MGFKKLATVLGLGDVESCLGVGGPNESLLCIVVRHRDTCRSAILIDASFSDDALDAVAVTQGLAQRSEDYRANSFLEEHACISTSH